MQATNMNNRKSQHEFQTNHNLLAAVEKNDIPTVRQLLEAGYDANERDRGMSTPLMRAAFHGYSDLLTLLLGFGADANLVDKLGKTALHYAAQEQHETATKILLDGGAPLNAQDNYGNAPLHNAVYYSLGRGATIRLLRERGANENLQNGSGVTPLDLAKTIANYDVLQHFGNKK